MESRSELSVGSDIGGKFAIEAVIGTGAMGTVYLARHLALDSLVALKVLHPHLVDNERIVARFLEEARALASLKSDHIARVLDTGRTRDGIVFLALEYVAGHDLEHELREHERLEPEQAVRFALDICAALAEAHGRGIIHRDLKPENLLLERRPDGTQRVKLADFGVAKRLYTKRERILTHDANPVGTPCYMSPEQIADSSSVDTRADIFSLGVVLYEMLSGFLPFGGSSTPETYMATLQANPTPLSELAPHVPAGLAAVVERCLKKSREDRYPDVGELAIALSHFGSEMDRAAARITDRSVGATDVDLDDQQPRQRSSSTPTSAPVHTSLLPPESIPGLKKSPSVWLLAAVATLTLAAPLTLSATARDVVRGRQPASALFQSELSEQLSEAAASDTQSPRPAARSLSVPAVGSTKDAVLYPSGPVVGPRRSGPEASEPEASPAPPSKAGTGASKPGGSKPPAATPPGSSPHGTRPSGMKAGDPQVGGNSLDGDGPLQLPADPVKKRDTEPPEGAGEPKSNAEPGPAMLVPTGRNVDPSIPGPSSVDEPE